MKRLKRVFLVLLTIIMCASDSASVYAFNRTEHDTYMHKVLFGPYKTTVSLNNDNRVEALECASYLCIDQFNGNGEKELEALKQLGVSNLPDSIKEIDYSAFGSNHRRTTHRGWDEDAYITSTEIERWKKRKAILINTVDWIFDFDENTSKRDSFCAIIYYIHILGDRIADEQYYPPAQIMELGGRIDKQDIAHELKKHIEILFSDQKHTHKYARIVSKMVRYSDKVSKLLKNGNGVIAENDYSTYKLYAERMMKWLCCYLPVMLKNESFFNKEFY